MGQPKDIQLLVLDVDGVLTDGSIYVNDDGLEMKRFHVRDGLAISAAQRVGLKIGILSGRSTRAVTLRMQQLQVQYLLQGCKDKEQGLEDLCAQAHVDLSKAAYLGDDLIDLRAMLRCGYPMAVADAVEEVRREAKYVTQAHGGHGAVREAIEMLLKAQNRWDKLVDTYVI